MAGDRRNPPLGGGNRRGGAQPVAWRARPGRGDRVTALILASKSTARRAVLEGAGVPFEAVGSGVDEGAAKVGLAAKRATPRQVAEALAEDKALAVSVGRPELVVGADQTLEFQGQL